MNKLLILYPKEFNCASKFERKVKRIIETLANYDVVFSNDNNLLIKEFFTKLHPSVVIQENSNWNVNDFSHAIIFDDGEVFTDELSQIKNSGKPFRLVKIAISRVVNVDRERQYKGIKTAKEFEYIGRGSYWGNPHSMFEDGDDRDEVIRKYKYDFDYEKFPHIEKKEVYKLVGKRLGCFCKPALCHGDVLAGYLNAWDDGK